MKRKISRSMNNILNKKKTRIILTCALCFAMIAICTGHKTKFIIRLIGESPEHVVLIGQEENDLTPADQETEQEKEPTVLTEDQNDLKEGQVVLTDKYGNTSGEWGSPIDVSDPTKNSDGKIGDESLDQNERIGGESIEEVYVSSLDEATDDDKIYIIPNENSNPGNENQTPETEGSESSENNGDSEEGPPDPVPEVTVEVGPLV